MRISDWSSDVCSSDLFAHGRQRRLLQHLVGVAGAEQVFLRVADVVLHVDLDLDDVFVGGQDRHVVAEGLDLGGGDLGHVLDRPRQLEVRAGLADPRELAEARSEEHTSALQSLMRISYSVFCLKKQNITQTKYN